MNQQDFGLRLKELRQNHALTQSQLASKIGISRQAYVNYETGRCMPPAEVIANLSRVFGVDLMELLYDHNTITFAESKNLINKIDRNDLFSLLELYSNLSSTSQKRVIALMSHMKKGGGK